MDNTELHYVTYDPEAIWDEMIANYVEAGGDLIYPGDEKDMLLRSVQADIVQLFAGVDNALRMATLRYAVDDYLDVIGELRGVERIEATQAESTVTITTNATGEIITLEAGTQMTADGVIFYELVDDIALNGSVQTISANIICSRAGSLGNGLLTGTEMSLAGPNSDAGKAVNNITVTSDAAGGNEREEDEAYRERIRLKGFNSVTTGPYQQYESVAKSVSSEIVDAKALNAGAGNVAVYLIFASDTGKAAIMQAVLDALTPDDIRPLTDSVSVYEATDVTYTLEVQYVSDNSSATTAAITEAASEYQEWQDGTIGLAFNPDRLMAMLYQAGCTRVSWVGESEFGEGGAIEYTEIQENERCKGTITLTAAIQA